MRRTFSELYCEQHGVPADDFEQVVLRRSLHRSARLLRPLLELNRDYFRADREFVRNVGRITHGQQFDSEALDFSGDLNNRGFLRHGLHLRISRRRLRQLVRQTFVAQSAEPSQAQRKKIYF